MNRIASALRASLSLGLCAVLASANVNRGGEPGFRAAELPPGWSIRQAYSVEGAQLAGMQQRLGAQLAGLRTQVLDVRGFPLQVNFVAATDQAEADRLEQKLAAGGRGEFIARRDTTVIEFAKMNLLAADRLRHELALGRAAPARWEVTFRVACVEALDYMEANRVFNLFLALEQDPEAEVPRDEIQALTADWTLGDALQLRTSGPGFTAEYTCDPAPVAVTTVGEVSVHRFEDLPVACGLPYVDVRAVIRLGDRYEPLAAEPGTNTPAPRWDGSERVAELAARVTAEAGTDRERLLAIFDHVVANVAFGGDVVGSRYGVDRVLDQGYGHCWDKSDAFVSLCRAAGLRTRQVGGWLSPLRSGHIWAEVHLEGEGWLPVDSTCTWLGTSDDYVPWFLTEDGEMPIVYLSWPHLRRAE